MLFWGGGGGGGGQNKHGAVETRQKGWMSSETRFRQLGLTL